MELAGRMRIIRRWQYHQARFFATVRKSEIENSPKAHHDMPVKLGINVRYNVNDRWSLQSGVNYSYLSSDIYRSSNLQESTAKQKPHYISIPFSASVSLHNKTFNVYLTAGGEAAKLVKGKAAVARTVYGSERRRNRTRIFMSISCNTLSSGLQAWRSRLPTI